MEHKERIKYCKVCKNRKFNNAIGVICGLTDEKPAFEHSCKLYDEDEEYIAKNKERQEYNPKKWKRRDTKVSESTVSEKVLDSKESKLQLDFFEIDPKIRDVILVKNKYDYFSMLGLLAYIYTPYHLFNNKAEFINNMEDPINLGFWLLMLLYPIIRYFLPFPKYKLDSKGIEVKNQEKLKWDNILSLSCYEDEDGEDKHIFRRYFFFKLSNNQIKKLSLTNYTINNKQDIKQAAKRKGIKLNDKELLESAILSFHNKYKKTGPNKPS